MISITIPFGEATPCHLEHNHDLLPIYFPLTVVVPQKIHVCSLMKPASTQIKAVAANLLLVKKSQEPPPPSQSHENNHHQNQFYEQAITITQTTHRHKQEKSDLVSIISENQSFLFLSLF